MKLFEKRKQISHGSMLEEDQSAGDVDEYELLAELEDDIETNLDHVLKNL